jgi:hypothetical protein
LSMSCAYHQRRLATTAKAGKIPSRTLAIFLSAAGWAASRAAGENLKLNDSSVALHTQLGWNQLLS